MAAATLLRQLEALKDRFEPAAADSKRELLRQLERRRLGSADEVLRLHEVLCFLRAYPDDQRLLASVESMLAAFAGRSDLRRYRRALSDTGIAGTSIDFRFFWPTARWLARRWPHHLSVLWSEFKQPEKLLELLPLLVPPVETGGFDELDLSVWDWIEELKHPDETDAAWIVRRIDAMYANPFVREALHDGLDLWFRLDPAGDTPTRTHAHYAPLPVTYQQRPLARARPDLRGAVKEKPRAVRVLTKREGQKLIDLARSAMVTRSRDLDVFAYGDPNDVRLVDFGEGLQFACIGFLPERRLLLHAVYGFLTLKNGVPIGYVLASALFRSAEVAFNTFETYRGAEAAFVFSRVLAMTHHLFGAEAFAIDPYQLGYGNTEGLKSGAWWFYQKLGFRPQDPDVRRLMRGELRRMRRNPRHRSSVATLSKLASEYVYLDLHPSRRGWLLPPLWSLSLAISRYLGGRFGAERERGIRTCAREAAQRLGVRRQRLSRTERQAWENWSPLILMLEGVGRWSRAEKAALVRIVRAKGGRHESDFVPLFDAHAKLKRALLKLAAQE
ncbi:MAG: hypothetical protein JSW67_12730 [Candidatus Latescibacterota bacterium]|nr:MAG: hypothetical protein JSW67_12730 [Candidatus Latescibacterota bacterium]